MPQKSIILEVVVNTPMKIDEIGREEALLKAGALQNAIFNSANFSSIATDSKGVIQIFNVGAERMLGYTAADVLNKITPADISDPQELIERAKALSLEFNTTITQGFDALVFKASRGIEDIYELTKIRKDGSRFPAVLSVTALRDDQSAIIGYLLIGTDNTARKQAEEALLKAGALQNAIFNSANFSSIATDAKGVIQIFNVGAERMLGYTAAEVMNKITPADISDSGEVIARAKALSAELGTPIMPGFDALVFKASRGIEDIYELTYIRKDGSRFPAVVSVTALRDDQSTIIGYLLIGTDNTARKQVDAQRDLLLKIIEESPDFISTSDMQSNLKYLNKAGTRMVGLPEDVDLSNLQIKDMHPDWATKRVLEEGVPAVLNKGYWRGETALLNRRDGHITPVSQLLLVHRDATGAPERLSTIMRDISIQKVYENQILENEQKLLEILKLSPISVRIAINHGHKVAFSNQCYAELIKNQHPEGDDPAKYYAQPRDYEDILKTVDRGDAVLNQVVELAITGGVTVWALSSYMPMQYQGEDAVLGWFYDITERKQAEDQFHAAVEASPNGMLMVNERGIVTLINAQVSSIFGYSEQELVGQSIHILLPQNLKPAHAVYVSDFLAKPTMLKMAGKRNLFGMHKDGRQIQVEIGLSPIHIRGKDHVLASIVDITERQETLNQLRSTTGELELANIQIEEERSKLADRVEERTVQLQLANHAKDTFLATMSHEIRTPLGGMLGMMDMLSLSLLRPEQRQQLEIAQLSGKNLLRIVNDILDWSKIEAGKLELALRNASVSEVLNIVANTYSQLASDKGNTLKVDTDPLLSEHHLFDPLRLSQILNNFTSNAVKFTQQGDVTISAQRVEHHDGIESVRFSVKDSGPGIDVEQQSRLFQHYEQATADTARMYGGTGLGLAICRRLAELMDGTLSVESTVGVGSTFSFTVSLPVADAAALQEMSQSAGQSERRASDSDISLLAVNGQIITILIVDDHPVNRMLLKQQLELLGVQVQAAEDGAKAFVLWQSSQFDLIITDCHMPEMDGYELSRRIRELEKQAGMNYIPIIAWTANVLSEETAKTQAAGMDDLLTKPTELSELRVKLLKWLPKVMANSTGSTPTVTPSKTMTEIAFDPSVLNTLVTNRASQVEMLELFNDQNHIDIAALKAILGGTDPVAVARAAHRIKGASRMMGAKELEALSIRIEQAAKQGDMSGARAAADKLDETAARLEEVVRRFYSEL